MANLILDTSNANLDHYMQHFVNELQNRLPNGIKIGIANDNVMPFQGLGVAEIIISFQDNPISLATLFVKENYNASDTTGATINILNMTNDSWQQVLNFVQHRIQSHIELLHSQGIIVSQDHINIANSIANQNNNNILQHNLQGMHEQNNNIGMH